MKLAYTDWDGTKYYSNERGDIFRQHLQQYVLPTLEEEANVRMALKDMKARANQSQIDYRFGRPA